MQLPQAVLSFGPSASLHPSHSAALVGPARLRPRVARVLRTTQLTTTHNQFFLPPLPSLRQSSAVCSMGGSASGIAVNSITVGGIALRTFRFAPSLPLRFACGPRPLTAAGGQGPQDNTAYDPAHIHSCRLLPARSTLKLSISTIPPPAPASTVHPQTVRSAPPHFAEATEKPLLIVR